MDSSILAALKYRLESECTRGGGLMDPAKAITCLNLIQRETCPEAYESEIVTAQRAKKEAINIKNEREQFLQEIDRTLFDFDDEIDKLSDVSE